MYLALAILALAHATAGASILAWNVQDPSSDFFADVGAVSTSKPLVIFLLPDFNLGQFAKFANVYSVDQKASKMPDLKAWMSASKGYDIYKADNPWTEIQSRILENLPSSQVIYAAPGGKKAAAYVLQVKSLEEIEKLVKQIKGNVSADYIGVILGSKGRQIVKRAADVAVPPADVKGVFYGTANCIFYLENAVKLDGCKYSKDGKAEISLVPSEVSGKCPGKDKNGKFTENTANIAFTLKDKDGGNVHNVKIGFGLGVSQYWKANISIDDKPAGGEKIVSVPYFSYRCHDTRVYCVKEGKHPNFGLIFNKFRVEPFGGTFPKPDKEGKVVVRFDEADDCVGFFSIGVLMGIFSAIFLFSIFFFGICMMASLSTMDRFDDPRQKPLQVNVRE